MSSKRVRVFAGPNGSGKSSLFSEFSKTYPTGPFVNADEIENKLTTKGLVDLKELGLKVTQDNLDDFADLPSSVSLYQKAIKEAHHPIEITVSENYIVDHSKESHSYEASYAASFIRHMLIEQGKSFSFETVMSHKSKIKEIQNFIEKGYRVYLYFVCIDDPEVNISRVANRVKEGGHNVAQNKIMERYVKTLELLHEVLPHCYRAYLFDNSKTLEMVAEVYNGAMELKVDNPPQWFIEYLLPHFTKK